MGPEAFQAMQRHSMVPNLVSYSALTSASEEGEQPRWALEVFQEMQRHSVLPNLISYSALTSGGRDRYSKVRVETRDMLQTHESTICRGNVRDGFLEPRPG